ncbi:MAG: hypothetical protein JW769_02525 [Parachlamydiales bacterium]|nr:hypothetical protein [Parachlamydiales bacterium]
MLDSDKIITRKHPTVPQNEVEEIDNRGSHSPTLEKALENLEKSIKKIVKPSKNPRWA